MGFNWSPCLESWNVQTANRTTLSLLILLILFSRSTVADSSILLPSAASDSFPACGLSCSLLQQAQSGCVPPNAPENDKSVYVSCFCQSSLIAQLHNTPDGTCDSCTSSSDRSLLQSWYNNYCSSGGNVKDGTSGTTASNTATATAKAAMAGNTASSDSGVQTEHASQTWWDSHYKWVVMIIVLVVAFTVITILGVWLKRRHDAKYPNLYHSTSSGANSGSGLLNRSPNSNSPAPNQPGARDLVLATPRRLESANTNSVASSSRTDVLAPKRSQPLRLQKPENQMADNGDVEIREVPR